jgi:DNA repair protein RAD16
MIKKKSPDNDNQKDLIINENESSSTLECESTFESIKYSTESESVHEEAPIIDPRKDISISEVIPIVKVERRKLNQKEMRKIKKSIQEDPLIYEIHPALKSEEDFIYSSDINILVDYTAIPYLKTKLMDHQLFGISWMIDREKSKIGGGILADEMGLGKTLQMIGLMLKGSVGDKNLVVVPAVALLQWISEIDRHAPNIFNIITYHGRTKNIPIVFVEDKFNLIMTTYGTVESSFRKGGSQLHEIDFTRILLDEAHIIKDNNSATTKAISFLKSNKRWGITGTPVQNRVNDLLSLVKFLKLDPHAYYFCKKCPCKSKVWMRRNEQELKTGYAPCVCGHIPSQHFSWWNRKIANPIRELGHTDQNEELFERLHQTTKQIILRRTKINLEKSLGMPSKVVIVKRCLFSPQELEFYTNLYSDTKTKFNSYAVTGEIGTNYAHIFELLQKMRMAVNHPFLTFKNSNVLGSVPLCGFCSCEADDPVKSKCNHVFCRAEVEIMLESTNKCPVCHVPITIDFQSNYNEASVSSALISVDNWQSSTKVEMLIEMLNSLKSSGKSPKSIVFSQFVNFLEILRWRLERAGFRCVKIYGSMSISQRKASIDEFNKNPEITVFLISLKAGGVALNLTEAENVFIMDLWWNPAVEEQAMDRIHRIGQYRPIRIHRLIIENSIESRVLILQQKKKALFETAVDNNMEALHRLSEDDLNFLFC